MYCTSCGAQNPDNMNYCRSCGTALIRLGEQETEQFESETDEFVSDEAAKLSTGIEEDPILKWPNWTNFRIKSLIRGAVFFAAYCTLKYLDTRELGNIKIGYMYLILLGLLWLYCYISCIGKASQVMVGLKNAIMKIPVFWVFGIVPVLFIDIAFVPPAVFLVAVFKGIIFGKWR